MIYYILCTAIMPGTPLGQISDLLEDVFIDREKAESYFDDLVLDEKTICKELWVKESSGKRKLIKTERKGEKVIHG